MTYTKIPGILGYHLRDETITGYRVTHVTITRYDARPLVEVLAGTVENRAGYGSADAARRVAVATSDAISAGYTHEMDPNFDRLSFGIRYQLYAAPDDYCDPTLELDRVSTVREAHSVLWLVRKLDRSEHLPTTPAALIARLRALLGVEVIHCEGHTYAQIVPVTRKPRRPRGGGAELAHVRASAAE